MTKECVVCGREFEAVGWKKFCSDECRKMYLCEYKRASRRRKGAKPRAARASGRVYTNTPERLAEIKAKYSRGIPDGEIEAWLS